MVVVAVVVVGVVIAAVDVIFCQCGLLLPSSLRLLEKNEFKRKECKTELELWKSCFASKLKTNTQGATII